MWDILRWSLFSFAHFVWWLGLLLVGYVVYLIA